MDSLLINATRAFEALKSLLALVGNGLQPDLVTVSGLGMVDNPVAVPVGFVLGWYKGVRTFIDPLINFFRALPPIALIPLVTVAVAVKIPTCSSPSGVRRRERPRRSAAAASCATTAWSTPWPTARSSGSGAA